MTKKEIMFMITMNIIAILINIAWALTDIETYIFVGITVWLPTIAFIKFTKEAIDDYKADEEI